MDQNPNQNNNPTADDSVNSAKSFDSSFDMSAINDAVAMSGNADDMQKTFDVNEISLENTPTSNAELEQQLKDDPTMRLSGATEQEKAPEKTPAEDFDPTKFDPVANSNIGEMPQSSSAASFIGGDIVEEKSEEKPADKPVQPANVDMSEAVLAADPVLQSESHKEETNTQAEVPKSEPQESPEPVKLDEVEEKQETPAEPTPAASSSVEEPAANDAQKPSVEALFATDDSELEAKTEPQPASAPAEEAPKAPEEAPKQEAAAPAEEKNEEPAPAKDTKKFKLSDKTVKPKSAQAPNMLSGKKRSPLPIILLCVVTTIAMSAGVIAIFYFYAK